MSILCGPHFSVVNRIKDVKKSFLSNKYALEGVYLYMLDSTAL